MQEEKPGYYAIIPANIRYDKELPPNAKLLYGEITALCNDRGYCWATNKYFADLYGVTRASISGWISKLIDKGYLLSELFYKENSKEIEKRVLKLNCIGIQPIFNTPIQPIFNTPIEEKLNTPIQEKFTDNSTVNNNTVVNNSSLSTNVDKDLKPKKVKKSVPKKPVKKSPPVAPAPQENDKIPKGIYKNFINVYHVWFLDLNGFPPDIQSPGQFSAAKSIIKFLERAVKIKSERMNQVLDAEQINTEILKSWKIVFEYWDTMREFFQKQTKLTQIRSNLQDILIDIKNGNTKNNQSGNKGGTVTGQTVVDAISERFNKS